MVDPEKRLFAGWWFWILLLLVATGAVVGTCQYVGMFGHTVAERVIYKNSFQYKEARESELATFDAQLAQIRTKLSNPNISDDERSTLEAQRASIEVLRDAAESRK